MPFLSRGAEYAIRAMLDVTAAEGGALETTKEVAEHQGIPKVFLPKIVQRLVQAGLLRAHRGPAGGIALSRPPGEINMRQIIEAMDGPIALNTCLLLPGECPRESICPVHEIWVKTQDDLLSGLESITLSKLVARGKELVSQQVVY
ncbi:MAG: Rrf2 family transcriptional regulator [Chloroflexi bacterium]|nr:Rrf2 family transcriptional regulator [Chloroflexota bacterium]